MKALLIGWLLSLAICQSPLLYSNWAPIEGVPGNASVVYGATQLPNGHILLGLSNGVFMRSIDDGDSWHIVAGRIQSGLFEDLSSDDEGTLYLKTSRKNRPDELYRSIDEGATWQNMSAHLPSRLSNAQWRLYVLPNSTLFIQSSDTCYHSFDNGCSWKAIVDDLRYTHATGIVHHSRQGDVWCMNSTDNFLYLIHSDGSEEVKGKLLSNSNHSWYDINCLLDVIRCDDQSLVVLTSRWPWIQMSTDDGNSWNSVYYNLSYPFFSDGVRSIWISSDQSLHCLLTNREYRFDRETKLWILVQNSPDPISLTGFLQTQTGTIIGLSAGLVYTRSNNSSRWKQANLPPSYGIERMLSLGNDLCIEKPSGLFSTSKDCVNFHSQPTLPFSCFAPCSQVRDSGILCFDYNALYYSSNRGVDWHTCDLPSSHLNVYARLLAIDRRSCLVVGSQDNPEEGSSGRDKPLFNSRIPLLMFSPDAGCHWSDIKHIDLVNRISREKIASTSPWLIRDAAVWGNSIALVFANIAEVFVSENGGLTFAQFPFDHPVDVKLPLSTHSILHCSNPLFSGSGDLFVCRDSSLYINARGSTVWQKALYQPPPNAWTLLSREVLHKDGKTSELLILSDSHNRVCVSVAGQPWKEIDSDSASLFDTFHSFAVGSFSDNSIQLLAASNSDGLLSTTVTGLHLFDADQDAAELNVSPNPVAGFLSIRLRDQSERILSVRVLSLNGTEQQVLKPEIQDAQMHIDCSAYLAGVYVLEVQCSSGVLRSQFVVSR